MRTIRPFSDSESYRSPSSVLAKNFGADSRVSSANRPPGSVRSAPTALLRLNSREISMADTLPRKPMPACTVLLKLQFPALLEFRPYEAIGVGVVGEAHVLRIPPKFAGHVQ